ncbi:MAG: REJ domain-containing protein [Acidobacteriaceae bacterium]
MFSRPYNFVARTLLVGCAFGLTVSALLGQTSSSLSSAPTALPDAPVSRMDVFMGYSYLAPHATVNTPLANGTIHTDNYSSIDLGAIGSFSYYFNRYVGGQVEYANGPNGQNDGISTVQGGMVLRYPAEGMTPFVHGLAGIARIGGPNYPGITQLDFVVHPYTWGPALTVGGGLDYDLPFANHRFGLRLFQADYEYMHADFGPQVRTGGRANIDAARLSSGILIHFGNIVPPPPVLYACSMNPASVFPGAQVTVTGTATNLDPKKTASYSWSGQGVTVGGTNSTATIDTANLQPGTYTVTGHVTEGKKPGQSADCTAQFTVNPYEPPTISCTANPTTVKPGESSTITCDGVSPQNLPLTYSYSASAGSISGTGNTATLSTTGAPSGTITVTGTVQDDKGHTASATTTVDVQAPPPPPAPKTQTLCSVTFNKDKRRPTRVDNEAKACLDDVALNAQQKADASLVVVGNSAPVRTPRTKYARRHAMTAERLAAQRAVNTKDYLVTQKGIDASRIQVRTGTTGQNEVENYLVPAGANFDNDVPGTTPVDENAIKAQPRNPVRHHHHRHHHTAAKKKAQ